MSYLVNVLKEKNVRGFFQQPINVKKFCKLYYLQHQTQKSIEYNFHIYIFYNLVRTVRLTPQFEKFIITSCHVFF